MSRGACRDCGGPTLPPGVEDDERGAPPVCATCLWGPVRPSTPAPAYAHVVHGTTAADVHRVQVRVVLSEHRRHRNVRACTGCDWSPSPVGRTGDPEAMGRRAAQFNTHLADLIVDTLAPQLLALPALDSRHAHGPATVTSPPAAEGHTPPGQREAPH